MNVYLIGYRGTGKTSLGRILSIKLNQIFVDTDDLIVESEGMLIPEIFKQKGEEYFREIEHNILEDISQRNDMIIATGGGMVIREDNRDLLKNTGTCILLTADPEIIFQRISGDKNRPSLTNHKSELDEIKTMLDRRNNWYLETAQLSIDTGKNDIKTCIQLIKKSLEA